MNWNGRKVLVAGGAGFLGSSLCHALARRGAQVWAVDSFVAAGGANLGNIEGAAVHLVRADIREVDLRPLCAGVDVIFNLAALTSHMGGQRDPLADLSVNGSAQVRLIQAAREAAPGALVVHASTRQIYGRAQSYPVREDHPVAPLDANGVSKFAGEQYWMAEHRAYGRPVVSLRLTNCYGPRMRIRDGHQGFLGLWIGRVLERRPFEIWGGKQIRDLTYVDDVTEAFLAAAATPICQGKVFNIGGPAPASLVQIANVLIQAAGDGRYTMHDLPADRACIDIGSYQADDTAFRRATGWSAGVSLETGMRRSIEWFRGRLPGYLEPPPSPGVAYPEMASSAEPTPIGEGLPSERPR